MEKVCRLFQFVSVLLKAHGAPAANDLAVRLVHMLHEVPASHRLIIEKSPRWC